ncbi:MAG: hypothetical protein AB8H80_08920 [Planctomycetota bacterium]
MPALRNAAAAYAQTALALAAALSPTALHAQSVQVLASATKHHGDIVTSARGLTLPRGEFTIGEMLDAAAAYLCRNFVYDPGEIADRQPFRLQRSLSLDAIGTEDVLHALLASRSLVALPLDATRGMWMVLPLDSETAARPMAMVPWRRPSDILARPNLRELVMTAVRLQHLDVRQMETALRSHFAMQRTWRPGAPTVSQAGPHTLVLQGYGDQLAQILSNLQALDEQASPPAAAPAPAPSSKLVDGLMQRIERLEQQVEELRKRQQTPARTNGR